MAELNILPNVLLTDDDLRVLNFMNSESIDLIYLDPPFNSKRLYNAPIGSKAAGTASCVLLPSGRLWCAPESG